MSIETIEKLVSEAVSMGVFLFIITGGEPYMRPEMFSIYRRYRQALFITVSNGTLIDEACAERIAACGNIIPVLSIEGTEALTDAKRGRGTYQKVINAMARLKRRKILFGFSSVLTAHSIDVLGSKTFIETMLRQGCSVGFYNDHVPFEQEDYADLPAEEALSDFRSRLAVLRRSYPLVLVHLPDDEYDENNRCTAVKDGAVHVNAQGFAEPCPFAHYARENVMFSSFRQVLSSPFLSAIKKHPNALEKGAVGCALACKQQLLAELAEKTGAVPTKSIPNPESAAAEKTGG
jgi:MoaA/NifB/PqqE/SkfB family radical SAM enzyme